MLHDPARLTALLLDPDRPVQIVIAGKAHPADDGGKRLIQQMVQFADDPEVRHRIVFLPDYDMAMARALVQGCDVWLNNPLRPLEACGTSGMKAALNGGLNLSMLGRLVGRVVRRRERLGDPVRGRRGGPGPPRRARGGRAVRPARHSPWRRCSTTPAPDGLPRRWLEMVAHTLRALGPRALATRMVREYVKELYVPAARSSRALAAGSADGAAASRAAFAGARELAAWKQRVTRPGRGPGRARGGRGRRPGPGGRLVVRASVALGELSPDDVSVEVVYGRVGDADEIIDPVRSAAAAGRTGRTTGWPGTSGKAELGRPGPFGYTVRVLPRHPLLAGPAELGLVTLPEAPAGMVNGDLR